MTSKVCNELKLHRNDLDNEKDNISRFAENETQHIQRWLKLSRMLDGKRILFKLEKLLSQPDWIGTGLKLKYERGILADYIANKNLIDSSLTTWVEEVYRLT